MTTHVTKRIAENNPWYVDDQFAVQMGSPAMRAGIERNWRIFADLIEAWSKTYPATAWRTLDSGCGDGMNLAALTGIAKSLSRPQTLFGCDYNNLRLERVMRAKRADGLFEASLVALPVATGSIDVILCNHVLEHIADDAGALRELYRVLAPGGLLVLGVPNEGCALARLRNHVIQPHIARTTDHVHFYTLRSLANHLVEAGFSIRDRHAIGFFLPHHGLADRLAGRAWGRGMLELLRRYAPSQAAGLIVAACKP